MKIKYLVVTVVLFSATALLFGVMYDLTYIEDKTLRTDSTNPRISSFGENSFVVWQEAKDTEFFDIYFQKIEDGNLVDEYVNLTQGKSFYPSSDVFASENNVYVLWEDRIDKNGYDGDAFYFQKSTDYGKTFDDVIMLGSSDPDIVSYSPITLMNAGEILYLFMFQWDPHTEKTIIVFRSSHDNGDTFGKPVPFIEFDKKNPSLFDVITVNETIYAVSGSYHGYSEELGEVQFRKIHPSGSLGDVIFLNKTGKFVNSLNILATEDGNDVYVVSSEIVNERNPDTGIVLAKPSLLFTKSSDGGNTFVKPLKINTNSNSGSLERQSIQAISLVDNVYLMWDERHHIENEDFHKTLYTMSDDRGETFDVAVHPLDELRSKYGKILTYGESNTQYFLTISKTNSFHEDGNLYFAKSEDGGVSISNVIDVTEGAMMFESMPIISTYKDHIHIVADIVHDKNCILYISSNDGGNSFSEISNLSPNGSLEDCLTK